MKSSQQLPAAYMVNGAIYLIRPDLLKRERRFINEDMFPLIMEDPVEGLDIDTPFDMDLAREYCKSRPSPFSRQEQTSN